LKERFTWDPVKAERNRRVHGVSFQTAAEVFDDPNHLAGDNYFIEGSGEQRYQIIGMTRNLVLLLVVFVDRSQAGVDVIHLISSRHERQLTMKKASTAINSAERPKISARTREAYRKRDRRLDGDPEAPQLPPNYWANATIGKYYRPVKTQISFRIDNDVLDWLKSKGRGHLSRINEILRDHMTRER
jgi:uncharacterized DUF497 family protein